MRALEIQRNGIMLAVVGASKAIMFTARISSMIVEEAATIDVRGMINLGDERESHVNWLELLPLNRGDLLSFRFIDSEVITPPISEVATDSEKHILEQEQYEERLKFNPPVPRSIIAIQPNASLQLSIMGSQQITATLEGGREFISFSILWNQWRPEHCRISFSSFSQQETLERSGGKEWFQGLLKAGEKCTVKIGV
jgi:hypothetical protein